MGDTTTNPRFEAFLNELRSMLPHLYDPLELRETPLIAVFNLQDSSNPVAELRQVFIDAIQALKPMPDVPVHSNTWRVYHILRYRYVEQSAQWTVANNMNLSVRQLRRQERDAEEALASYLWANYDLEGRVHAATDPLSPTDQPVLTVANGQPGRERELEWVKESFPSEVAAVSEMIDATLKTVDPLVRALAVQVARDIPAGLPPVTGQRVLLRQAFLSLVTAAIHAVPGGEVRIMAEREADCIVIRLEAEHEAGTPSQGSDTEHLQMARQCIALFGGELVSESTDGPARCFVAALRLPVTEPVPVLVIDDNLDTLHLFQRYLSGTRYQFVGVSVPDEVLTVAEAVHPKAVVLDVMLPEVDGWELLGRLREHPATRGVPTVVCTVMPQEQLALALGAAGYLRKPVSRDALVSALDRQVNSSGTESG